MYLFSFMETVILKNYAKMVKNVAIIIHMKIVIINFILNSFIRTLQNIFLLYEFHVLGS